MAVLKFYPLTVKDIRLETPDCISVAFDVPEHLWETFRYLPGQYLTLRKSIDGMEIRRNYSICSSLRDNELRVAIKRVENGKFSGFAHNLLTKGSVIDVMPPLGSFVPKLEKEGGKEYLAFAAGSGITPIMGIMKTVMEEEPESSFTLVYGNRERSTIIFREEIEGLKNKYMERFRVFHVLSREYMDAPLFNGRIDAEKCKVICHSLVSLNTIDEVFICGPEEMLLSVKKQLTELGMSPEYIHIELFTSPDQPKATHEAWIRAHKANDGPVSKVSVTLDGTTFDMDVPYLGNSILDEALKRGADLPYACKGGVCATCRAKLVEGEVEMEVNYSLEANEVRKGFILTCQSHPKTARVVVDFDQR